MEESAIEKVEKEPLSTGEFFSNKLDIIKNIRISRGSVYKSVLTSFDGMLIEATGMPVPVGTLCNVDTIDGSDLLAQVIGFRDQRIVLMVINGTGSPVSGAKVTLVQNNETIQVGASLLGRVIDGMGNPIDEKGMLTASDPWPLNGFNINPLQRAPVQIPFDTGVRAINGLLSIGVGQRMGIVAGSGVGKSVLLGMMVRNAVADVVIVALIGERSREVNDFVRQNVPHSEFGRTVIVAVPAGASAAMRINGAYRAAAIAEYFREQGKNVLLILDSLTRVAHAQREIGLALGEQPTSRGYPPSVIALLPKLIERAGTDGKSGGAITALYTVLADGDDTEDPVVDTARAILDGHIILSRALSERAVYPAIDISASISRTMNEVVDPAHQQAARNFKTSYSIYEDNRDFIMMGAYKAGQSPQIDKAIEQNNTMTNYLLQHPGEKVPWDQAREQLCVQFSGQ